MMEVPERVDGGLLDGIPYIKITRDIIIVRLEDVEPVANFIEEHSAR